MSLIADQKIQYITDMRNLSDLFALVRRNSAEMVQKWNSLGLGAGNPKAIVDADMVGTSYDGLTADDITGCVTTAIAFELWVNAGHDDNLAKIRK